MSEGIQAMYEEDKKCSVHIDLREREASTENQGFFYIPLSGLYCNSCWY